MLRPANDVLKQRKAETALIAAVLAGCLVISGAVLLAAAFVADGMQSYLKAYRPIVYLEADVDGAQAAELADEVGDWPAVAQANVRAPQDAFGQLRERIGPQKVAKLGVRPTMMPYSVVLVPATPVVGHLDLIAAVSGLETRPSVDAVDVPSPRGARTLSAVRWLMWFGAVSLVGSMVVGVGLGRVYLGSLAERLADETQLLAAFGASPTQLSRPTLIRGVTVGALAGVVACMGLLGFVLWWHGARPELLGVATGQARWSWAVVAAPIILGPAVGLCAGWLANRSRRINKRLFEESPRDDR